MNVGSRQLVDSSFLPTVVEILDETGVDPDSVWFEITESALLADARAATSTLREIRGLGIHLSVDDFGTGYSSLTYLKRFPVEAIKIDRSFVSGLGIEDEDSTIVEAVIQLGKALNLTVVAEGVESPCNCSGYETSTVIEVRATCSVVQGRQTSSKPSSQVIECHQATG